MLFQLLVQVEAFFISCSSDGTIKIWDLAGKQVIRTFEEAHKGGVSTFVISKDKQFIVSGGEDKAIRIWDIKELKQIDFIPNVHNFAVAGLGITSDGNYLVTGSSADNTKLWDLKEKKCIHEYTSVDKRYHGNLVPLALSPDDRFIVTAGYGHRINIYSTGFGQPDPVKQSTTTKNGPKSISKTNGNFLSKTNVKSNTANINILLYFDE